MEFIINDSAAKRLDNFSADLVGFKLWSLLAYSLANRNQQIFVELFTQNLHNHGHLLVTLVELRLYILVDRTSLQATLLCSHSVLELLYFSLILTVFHLFGKFDNLSLSFSCIFL